MGVTFGQYASGLALRGGAKTIAFTHANQIGLVAVMVQEGTACRLNPMATEEPWPRSTLCNSAGVRNYASLLDSFDAVLATLRNGDYAPVLEQLASGACACTLDQAWAEGPWGTWHNYPPAARGAAAISLAHVIAKNPAPYLGRVVPGS